MPNQAAEQVPGRQCLPPQRLQMSSSGSLVACCSHITSRKGVIRIRAIIGCSTRYAQYTRLGTRTARTPEFPAAGVPDVPNTAPCPSSRVSFTPAFASHPSDNRERCPNSPASPYRAMRALVKNSAGPGFSLAHVPVPEIREDEVLIRVRRAGVCGTDVHIYEWDNWASSRCKPPFVVGHEFAGNVVQVGRLVTDVAVGDRVTAEGHIVDGRCPLCRTGNSHVCPHTKIIGVDRDGCFADYITMPATNVWHLDDNVSYEIGSIHDP